MSVKEIHMENHAANILNGIERLLKCQQLCDVILVAAEDGQKLVDFNVK